MFEGDVQIHRCLGDSLRHFTRANDLLIQRMDASDLSCPFCERFGDALRTADHPKMVVPVGTWLESRTLAVGEPLPGHDEHWYFKVARPIFSHHDTPHTE